MANKMDPKDSSPDLPRQEVVFEDYLYYAALQRREEDVGWQSLPNSSEENEKKAWFSAVVAVTVPKADPSELPSMTEDEIERANASRAMRIASWTSAFYLITTDILGPFSAPYAVSQLGWVPATILYVFSSVRSLIPRYLLTSFT